MSNGHILEAYVHIHIKDEVSMTTYLDRRAHKRKVTKWLPFENYRSDWLKKFTAHIRGIYAYLYKRQNLYDYL